MVFKVNFADDRLCAQCAFWFTPDNPFDDSLLCPFCTRAKNKAKDRANFYKEALFIAHERMLRDYAIEDSPDSLIYFVRGKTTRRIKIGYTASNVYRRLADLQVGSPDALLLLGVIRAPFSFEREIHKILEAYHSHGEWFDTNSGLLDFVKKKAFLPEKPSMSKAAERARQSDKTSPDLIETPHMAVIAHDASIKANSTPFQRLIALPVRPAWLLTATEKYLRGVMR